jgi:Leucine-rich repeat (LRR) protein
MYMSNSISKVPQELRNLGVRNMNITRLDLSAKNLTNLPPSIGKLKKLELLFLYRNNLTSLPPQIGNLKKLTALKLRYNNLESLPPQIGNLTNLRYLDLGYNNLESLPPQIGNLKYLRELVLEDNIFKSLPPQIGNLKKLEELRSSSNHLESLPKEIGKLKNLTSLGLAANKLTSIPKEIGKLKKLDVLFLGYNKLTSLPDEIGRLPKLTSIYIHSNPDLRTIPRTLDRSGLRITKNSSTRFEHIPLRPVQRRNVPLNTNRNDPISGYIFSVGNNALNLGYNKYLTEKSLLNWIKTKNKYTNITNINTLYSLSPNTNIVSNPFTRQPLFRRNLNFVKFVKSNKPNTLNPRNNMIKKAGNAAQIRLNTPNTLAKKLNNTKLNNKPNTPNPRNNMRKKAGNAAQSRRTNVNNNN